MFRKSGLTPKNLILEPFASKILVLDNDEKQEGVCLVDIGGGTTDVAYIFRWNYTTYIGHSIWR